MKEYQEILLRTLYKEELENFLGYICSQYDIYDIDDEAVEDWLQHKPDMVDEFKSKVDKLEEEFNTPSNER